MTPTPVPAPEVPLPPAPTTIAACQQRLLDQLQSGNYVLSSGDKEGSRLLCYYRQAFLYAEVGEDGTSLVRLPHASQVISHVWRGNNYKLVPAGNAYTWSYDLTEAEQLEKWQAVLARLTPATTASRQFVDRIIAEFTALPAAR